MHQVAEVLVLMLASFCLCCLVCVHHPSVISTPSLKVIAVAVIGSCCCGGGGNDAWHILFIDNPALRSVINFRSIDSGMNVSH